MRCAGVIFFVAFAAIAAGSVKVELGPGVSVTVPRTPREWHAPLRDLDAEFGKLHVTAGVLPSTGVDLKQRALHLANELAEQHDSDITWKGVKRNLKGRTEVWFDSRQEGGRRLMGVVAVLRSGSVVYAVTCIWPRTSSKAEADARKIVSSFRTSSGRK